MPKNTILHFTNGSEVPPTSNAGKSFASIISTFSRPTISVVRRPAFSITEVIVVFAISVGTTQEHTTGRYANLFKSMHYFRLLFIILLFIHIFNTLLEGRLLFLVFFDHFRKLDNFSFQEKLYCYFTKCHRNKPCSNSANPASNTRYKFNQLPECLPSNKPNSSSYSSARTRANLHFIFPIWIRKTDWSFTYSHRAD